MNGTAPNPRVFLDHWISPEYPNPRVALCILVFTILQDIDHEQIMIYIFGFQEIVELTTSSIVAADETNMKNWAIILRDSINKKRKKSQVRFFVYLRFVPSKARFSK